MKAPHPFIRRKSAPRESVPAPALERPLNGNRPGAPRRPDNPLSVEDLLVDVTRDAIVTPTGELLDRTEATPQEKATGLSLVKARVWG